MRKYWKHWQTSQGQFCGLNKHGPRSEDFLKLSSLYKARAVSGKRENQATRESNPLASVQKSEFAGGLELNFNDESAISFAVVMYGCK